MAFIDQGQVVVRVVYDGPPQAGKTSSLQALGKSLGREVVCAGESEGRTLYFDWMDYVGGLFQGRSIRCQVVTVPGQPSLWPRRRALLESADVVVFVADSEEDRLTADLEALAELHALLAEIVPSPAVILQANKRDLPSAVPLGVIRERLSTGGLVAVSESVASAGLGIRETFVLAVRLALDRVRELMRIGALTQGGPDVASPEELLEVLRGFELEAGSGLSVETAPVSAPTPVDSADTIPDPESPESVSPDLPESSVEGVPRPPDPSVPGGMIWPPVGGRVILHESEPGKARMLPLAAGGWADLGNPLWLIHSPARYRFERLEDGRELLVDWARWHARLAHQLSSRRCVVLSEVSERAWRLWQIVGRGKTLRSLVSEAFSDQGPEELAHSLVAAGEALLTLRGDAETRRLNPSVDSVGFEAGRPVFLGLLPPTPSEAAGAQRRPDGEGSPLSDLGFLVQGCLAEWPGDRATLLAAVTRTVARRSSPERIASLGDFIR